MQISDHICAPPLTYLQINILLVLGNPESDTAFQLESHESRVEGENSFPCHAGHAAFDGAQDMTGFLGCKYKLPGHIELPIKQHLQVLLSRAALNESNYEPALSPAELVSSAWY